MRPFQAKSSGTTFLTVRYSLEKSEDVMISERVSNDCVQGSLAWIENLSELCERKDINQQVDPFHDDWAYW